MDVSKCKKASLSTGILVTAFLLGSMSTANAQQNSVKTTSPAGIQIAWHGGGWGHGGGWHHGRSWRGGWNHGWRGGWGYRGCQRTCWTNRRGFLRCGCL